MYVRKSVPPHAFGIYPKISEVDSVMKPEIQVKVFEVHPELCFLGA